jgi:hypothetical protein
VTEHPHEGHIDRVRNHLGYDAGFTTSCSCSWQSGELREREGQALIDHFRHLTDIGIRPKERSA